MSDIEESGAASPQGMSRRTVTKAMAWAVPVVAVAAAAPFAAASVPPGTLVFSGAGCKLPGNSSAVYKDGYAFQVSVTNTTPNPITINITSAKINGTPLLNVKLLSLGTAGTPSCGILGGIGSDITIPANTVVALPLALISSSNPNSANAPLEVDYTRNDQPTQASATTNSLPPFTGGGGSCPLSSFTLLQRACIISLA